MRGSKRREESRSEEHYFLQALRTIVFLWVWSLWKSPVPLPRVNPSLVESLFPDLAGASLPVVSLPLVGIGTAITQTGLPRRILEQSKFHFLISEILTPRSVAILSQVSPVLASTWNWQRYPGAASWLAWLPVQAHARITRRVMTYRAISAKWSPFHARRSAIPRFRPEDFLTSGRVEGTDSSVEKALRVPKIVSLIVNRNWRQPSWVVRKCVSVAEVDKKVCSQ